MDRYGCVIFQSQIEEGLINVCYLMKMINLIEKVQKEYLDLGFCHNNARVPDLTSIFLGQCAR